MPSSASRNSTMNQPNVSPRKLNSAEESAVLGGTSMATILVRIFINIRLVSFPLRSSRSQAEPGNEAERAGFSTEQAHSVLPRPAAPPRQHRFAQGEKQD